MGILSIVLLVLTLGLVAGAEWPRLAKAAGRDPEERRRRERAQRKAQLRVVRTEEKKAASDADEFVESVRRDLERLPTFERDPDR